MNKLTNLIHGWLVIDKPLHLTSAQVVSRVRQKLHKIKVGHSGTLDPLATGVLPLALGEATKSIQYIVAKHKKYFFEVTWGEERATDDSEGEITRISQERPDFKKIQDILPLFQGTICQMPPLYSALKIQGRRACDLMRQHADVQLQARSVQIDTLKIHSTPSQDRTLFEVTCGKGTYIRALARDMGRHLGCFGYASMIDRLEVGFFKKNQAISLETLASLDENILLKEYVKKIQDVLDDIPAISISQAQAKELRLGRTIPVLSRCTEYDQNQRHLCIDENQQVVAFVRLKDFKLFPERVFNI